MSAKVVVIRGTSGSGKTYIAEQIMTRLGKASDTRVLGPRSKIGGYLWRREDGSFAHGVVGRYETACGGCDGLSWKGAADDIEGLIGVMTDAGASVMLEGLMVSTWGADRLLRLNARAPGGLFVLHLTTPLDVCLDSVRARRAARAAAEGKEAPELNPKNTSTKHKGLEVHTTNQLKRGVNIERHTRESALARALELLNLSGEVAPTALPVVSDEATGEAA